MMIRESQFGLLAQRRSEDTMATFLVILGLGLLALHVLRLPAQERGGADWDGWEDSESFSDESA